MTASQKLIVIIGATGAQGGSVLATYAADPLWRIRAVSRNASSPKAQALVSKYPNASIETVSAELNDVSSLAAAFDGAHAIFGVTDFWTLYGDEKIQAQAAAAQKPANELCFDLEVQQGKNIFDAASRIPTLERLVFSGLSNASKLSGGKYNYVLHFDSKAVAVEYGQETYPELWTKTSVLQAGFYVENFLAHPLLVPRKDSSGNFAFPSLGSSDAVYPLIAAGEDTGVVTKALVEQPAGKNVIVYRELISLGKFVEIWGKTLGVEAKMVKGELPAGMPDAMRRELEETFEYGSEFGYWGSDKNVIHPKDLGLTMGSVAEWVRAQDWSSVLNG